MYLVIFLVGILAAKWLYTPLAALLRAAIFVLSIGVAYRVTMLIVPIQLDLDWRGFWGSAVLGLIFMLVFGGAVFYALGWRGRVAATEAEEHERIRQKAIKDRALS